MQMPYFLLLLLIIHIMLLLQLFIRSIYFIMTLVKQVTVKQHTSLIEYIDLLILKVFVILRFWLVFFLEITKIQIRKLHTAIRRLAFM